jgi:hypothetical protein
VRLTELSHMKQFMYHKCAKRVKVMLNLLDSERMLRRKLLLFKINPEKFYESSESIVFDLTNPNKTFTLKE